MICKFCGLNNADDAAFCSRCGSPLRENRQAAPVASADPVVDDDKKTMRMETRPDESAAGGMMRHDCGYPLLPGMQVCPKCHLPVAGAPTPPSPAPIPPTPNDAKKTVVISNPAQQPVQQASGPKVTERFPLSNQGGSSAKVTERFPSPNQGESSAKATERFVYPESEGTIRQPDQGASAKKTERFVSPGYQGGGVNKKTVNIHQVKQAPPRETQPVVNPHCSLRPLPRTGDTTTLPAKHDYNNAKVVLNRQNTDPENYSITSQQQAMLTFEDGKWYIEDKSAYKTTYIRVTQKTELHEGDIVAMGDREFEFSTK